jgi:cytoskeleton protein RodZ
MFLLYLLFLSFFLNGERRIDNPDLVEIYAGRPDLVQLSSPDAETRTLGAVDDIRWIPLSPAP